MSSHSTFADEKSSQKDENDIENLIITSSPLGRSVLQSTTPVSILSGERLEKSVAATLGETLKSVPGVNSTYFGPVASSPIIRGLDGPRVKIVQNGMDSSDASRIGADHVATAEASTATQIEVLRGPSTLLYGSGAIGGVVNVVDNRLPKARRDEVSGRVSALYDSVSNERTASTDINGGKDNIAWHFDAYTRKTDDYDVPTNTLEDGDRVDSIENSDIDSQGFTIGAGWIGDDVTVSLSYGRIDTEYGIPGHGHEEEHEEEGEEHEEEEHEEEEQPVFASLEQDRFQGMVDWKNLSGWFTEVHWHNAYTDYQHSEIEEGEIGTTFKNDSLESRLWAKHKAVNGWEGVIGLHYTDSEFSAQGEEAFTPSTDSTTTAIFVLEEKTIGKFLWQLGARIEDVSHDPENEFFANTEINTNFDEVNYTAGSLSAGFVYQLDKSQSLAANYAYSERAPSSAEIYSNGIHISTSTFEVGAGFNLLVDDSNPDDLEFTLEQSDQKVKKEISNNLDLTYRLQTESLHVNFSVFYNQIDNYLFQQNTGLEFFGGEEGEEEEFPVFIFSQQDAELYGFEADVDWHLNESLRVSAFTDFIRAKLDDSDNGNDNLPRIPPMRFGTELHWEQGSWHAELGATYYSDQDDISDFETETDGYTIVSAAFNYYLNLADTDITLYAKANNLTDELARVHSSFIKDVAPLPGRSFVLGAKVSF